MNSSWAFDLFTSDYANDDDFWGRSWIPSSLNESEDFLEVVFDEPTDITKVGFVELYGKTNGYRGYDPNEQFQSKLKSYEIQLWDGESWIKVPVEQSTERIRMHDIGNYKVEKVRIVVHNYQFPFGIVEMMVY